MSLNFNHQQFNNFASQNKPTILFKKLVSDLITPVLAFSKLKAYFDNYSFLFESVEKGNNKGRFSLIGLMPSKIWKAVDGVAYIDNNHNFNSEFQIDNKPSIIESLRSFIKSSQFDYAELNKIYADQRGVLEAINMASGVFGYASYDLVRFFENIPNRNLPDPIGIPQSIFIKPQIILVFDSLFDQLFICSPVIEFTKTYQEIKDLIEKIESIIFYENQAQKKIDAEIVDKINHYQFKFTANVDEKIYCEMVKKAKEYIINGDVFQVLPSQRFVAEYPEFLNEFDFYRSLRIVNPSPFLFYFKFNDFVITGSSPEIMASLKDEEITIRPLAGTRKRGINNAEDKLIAQELLKDEKELAEHLMLIDLGRNDVGRVAKAGSVVVTEKMSMENYSHVMHISSTVKGKLQNGYDALDVMIAGFPAGTVSGAPKIRAMEIIEEIESEKRSFYAGCVGYFASNGNSETCITLRSALFKNNKIYLQSGAGVVFDSDPKSEYQECINKARALMVACDKIKDFFN